MAFCGGRTAITKTNVDIDAPLIGGVGKNNVMGCSDPRFVLVPKGSCNELFDPDNMKICNGLSPVGFGNLPFIDQYETCNAPTSTFASPNNYCTVPADILESDNQTRKYGLNCDNKRAVPSCAGLNIYKRYNNLDNLKAKDINSNMSKLNSRVPQETADILTKLKNWDTNNRDKYFTTEVDFENDDLIGGYASTLEWNTRLGELRSLCKSSYSSGLGMDTNFNSGSDFALAESGENPWEYCEWSDTFNTCSVGGSGGSADRNFNCRYVGS